MTDSNLAGASLKDLGIPPEARQQLEAAGLTTGGDLLRTPLDQLFAIITGQRLRERLVERMDRQDEYAFFTGKKLIEVAGLGTVSVGELRQIISLVGTARQFGFDSVGELKAALQVGVVSWEQVAKYRLETKAARQSLMQQRAQSAATLDERAQPLKQLAENGPPQLDLSRMQEEIDEVITGYAHDYDTTLWTGSDLADLRRLARLEVFVTHAQAAQMSVGSLEGLVQYATQLRGLSDQINAALVQIRNIKTDLGITLKARTEQERQSEAHEVLTDYFARSKKLVAERCAIFIHCGVRQALFMPIFPRGVVTSKIKLKCHLCGEVVDFELVPRYVWDTYVEAGDFVPVGTPEGAFVREGRDDTGMGRNVGSFSPNYGNPDDHKKPLNLKTGR